MDPQLIPQKIFSKHCDDAYRQLLYKSKFEQKLENQLHFPK